MYVWLKLVLQQLANRLSTDQLEVRIQGRKHGSIMLGTIIHPRGANFHPILEISRIHVVR